jgi:hypothetical protein
MKDRQPWSVRGVTREARAKAARAASQQHQTIGEWVTLALIAAADRDLGLEPGSPPETDSPATNLPAKTDAQQRELTQALGALVRYLESSQTGDVARRLERTEHVLMGRIEQMAAGLYSLMQTMETRTVPVVEGESGARLMLPDQSRLADAVEKVVGAEAGRQDQMAAIAEALTLLAAKVGDPGVAVGPAAAAETDTESIDDAADDAADDDAAADGTDGGTDCATDDAVDDEQPEPVDNRSAEVDDQTAHDGDRAAKPVEPASLAARVAANPPAEPEISDTPNEPEAPAVSDDDDRHSATAAWMAGDRDEVPNDVVAAIRARNANRAADGTSADKGAKRGLLGRLFGRG